MTEERLEELILDLLYINDEINIGEVIDFSVITEEEEKGENHERL